MVTLNNTIHLVILRFSFSNPDAVPHAIRHRERKVHRKKYAEQKIHANDGIMVIQPKVNCDLGDFSLQLEIAGYEMVDAFYQKHLDQKDVRGKKIYCVVQYLFVRHTYAEPSKEFKKIQYMLSAELQQMVNAAFWRVRAFSNQFYQNGQAVEGERALNINLEARRPLCGPDGKKLLIWNKNKYGERLGDAPFPIQPAHCLKIVDNNVIILTV